MDFDYWVVYKIGSFYKVLAGNSGSYAAGDNWRLNSGIVEVEDDGAYYIFRGYSGSEYRCHMDSYRLGAGTAHVGAVLDSQGAELMPEDTDWLSLDYKDSKFRFRL